MNVRSLLSKLLQFALSNLVQHRIIGWGIYGTLGASILAIVASIVSCTQFSPLEQLKATFQPPDQSVMTRNLLPLGGANEKSDRSPCESVR